MLVDNAKQWWKMYSVWALGVCALIFAATSQWDALAPLIGSFVDEATLKKIGAAAGILGIVGRILKQTATTNPFPDTETSDGGPVDKSK